MLHKSILNLIIQITIPLLLTCETSWSKPPHHSGPNVCVVFVIDQFAYHYLWKLKPFFKYGLKKILDKGTVYHDATYPHAMPSTPTGHAALSTGTFGYIHGITGYGWIDEDNRYRLITEDDTPESTVFSLNGLHDYGRSAKNLMADTICDQFSLSGEPSSPTYAFAISLKSRSAIMLAGQKGKAIWFDDTDGGLTSSKAYFDSIPKWLKKANKSLRPRHKAKYRWNYFHNCKSKAYSFSQIKNYEHSSFNMSRVGKTFRIDTKSARPYSTFIASPFGDRMVIETAKRCIKYHLNINEHRYSRMLVFVCLSGFDYSGHLFGPDSLEQIDMLYHLDKQIGKFISAIQTIAGRKKSLFIVTSDHGVMPIPEVLNDKGFSMPKRICVQSLIEELNSVAKDEFGVENIVKHYEAPQFFLDKAQMSKLSPEQREKCLQKLKNTIKSKEGIRDCWTLRELETTDNNVKNKYQLLYAKQIYKGRAGDLICLTEPYKMLTKYPKGTSHATPYRYDTHVPLAFYQTGVYDSGVQVQQPVSMLQFPLTLSRLINCPAPSCAQGPVLPGLYKF